MTNEVKILAHNGVDHSTGATHETSRDTVNDVSVFIAVTLVAGITLYGILLLVKKYVRPKPTDKKGKK